jgi:hypothetical protein
MMQRDSKLRDAVANIKAGDKQAARSILVPILRSEPQNEIAWLLLSYAVDEKEYKRDCLERVLEINPANEKARKRLAEIDVIEFDKQSQPQQTIKKASEKTAIQIGQSTSETTQPANQRTSGNKIMTLLGSLLVIGLLFLCVFAYTYNNMQDNDGTSSEPSKSMAWVMCEDFVKDRLKAIRFN